MKVDKTKWKKMRMGDVCHVQMGLSPDSASYNVRNEGIPFYQGNADFGKRYPKERIYCNNPIRLADVGDILISVRAPIGAVNEAHTTCCIGRGLASLTPYNDILNKNFLRYILINSNEALNSCGTGATFKAIKKSTLETFQIAFPKNVSEQQAIAAELDTLQSVIGKLQEQLNDYDKLAQSVFHKMFGDVLHNDKDWVSSSYEKQLMISSGGTPSKSVSEYWDNGDIPWICSNMCTNEVLYKTDGKFITKKGLDNSSAKMYPSGTVLIALVGATIGKTALLATTTTTNQNIAGLTIKDCSELTPFYLFYHTMYLYPLFQEIGGGKFTISNQKFIKGLPLVLPPLPLQHQFAERVEAIEAQKALVRQQIADARQLFDSRMQYYFE